MGIPNRQIGQPSSTENTLLHNILSQIVRLTEVLSTSGGGATSFIQLSDVPSSYLGQTGKGVRVNAGETGLEFFSIGGSGTVTTVSVVSANGFAGNVVNATTTPAITISTSITGLLKGNGTAISAATAADIPATVLTINEQVVSYTLALSDQTSPTEVVMNVGTANNLTVPPNGTIAFPVGTQIILRQKGAGLTTIVQGSGVTITPSSGSLTMPGQGYSAFLIKTGTNTWTLDNGSPALVSSDITTALGYTPWSASGTTTITAASTITTSVSNFNIDWAGTWTAAANNSYHMNFGGSFTSRNTASDTLYGYKFEPTLAVNAGAPATQTLVGVYINPTFTGTATKYGLKVKSATQSFNVSSTLSTFANFGGTGLVIANGSLVLSNSTADPTLSNTIQVGTVQNLSTIASQPGGTLSYSSASHVETSGTATGHSITSTFAPASGTAIFKNTNINGAINETNGGGNVFILSLEPSFTAIGTAYGIDYNPTGTPTTHYGIVSRPTGALNGFGTATPTSTLQVVGSFAMAYVSKASSYNIASTDGTIEVTATGQTMTLPTAVGCLGRIYTIKLTASGSSTVATTSSQNIDSSTTYSLSAQYKYVTVQSNNANWLIIANN